MWTYQVWMDPGIVPPNSHHRQCVVVTSLQFTLGIRGSNPALNPGFLGGKDCMCHGQHMLSVVYNSHPVIFEVPAIEMLIIHEHGCMTEGRPEICLDYPPSDHGIVPPISQFYPFLLVTFPHKSPFSPQKCQHLRAPSHQTGSRPENLGSGGETVKHRIPINVNLNYTHIDD